MDSLPEEFFEELNELLKVEALEELERDLEEVDVITDHLPDPNEESKYWEMKAEVYFGI